MSNGAAGQRCTVTMVTAATGAFPPKTNLLVHLMADELEVGDLCAVLDQPPHVLAVGLVDVVVDRFQVQAVHGGKPPDVSR